jgi:hypothetical protein
MKQPIFWLLLVVLTLTGISPAMSQTACPIRTDVYFINGVNRPSKKEVADDSIVLDKRIRTFSHNATGVSETKYLYNPSDGLLRDAYEFAVQKVAAAFNRHFYAFSDRH